MKAIWNGSVIADSDDTVVVENNHYFPCEGLTEGVFVPSDHTSVCSWKGTARYFHVEVDGQRNENAAWYYPQAKDAAKGIEGRVAFWKGVTVTA